MRIPVDYMGKSEDLLKLMKNSSEVGPKNGEKETQACTYEMRT